MAQACKSRPESGLIGAEFDLDEVVGVEHEKHGLKDICLKNGSNWLDSLIGATADLHEMVGVKHEEHQLQDLK